MGSHVNLSSVSALGNRGQANYSTNKAGLQGLTNAAAVGKFGITVNAIAPGFKETDVYVATADRVGVPFEQFKADAVARIRVGRTGVPDDVDAVAASFAQSDAGSVAGRAPLAGDGPCG